MRIQTPLAAMTGDYDWEEVFRHANGETTAQSETHSPTPIPGSSVSGSVFGLNDVAELLGSVDGENDEDNWIVVGKLKDGRFFSITAGCDYTGWY